MVSFADDIMVMERIEVEHLDNLKRVFQRLREHGIGMKHSKCTFLITSVQYLGHRIDAEGLHATDDKVRAIMEAPVPKNVQEIRSFLGLLNYHMYRRFIPNLTSLLHPLNELLCQDIPLKWTKEHDNAFKAAKTKIVAPNVLVHYNLPIRLAGDASAYGVGALISHVMDDGTEQPIAFGSQTLLPSEKNYSQVEKEALSLIFSISKFHTYLYGKKLVLATDHKPLTTILGQKKGQWQLLDCSAGQSGFQHICMILNFVVPRSTQMQIAYPIYL